MCGMVSEWHVSQVEVDGIVLDLLVKQRGTGGGVHGNDYECVCSLRTSCVWTRFTAVVVFAQFKAGLW